MATASTARELLRPPPHRGPLIASGAVLLTVGLVLGEVRLDAAAGVQLLVFGLAAALILGLGVQAPNEGGRPPAYQSVLLVCGLLLLYAALLRLADVIGADFDEGPPFGALFWTGVVEAVAAGWVAGRRRSAICALISAVAAVIAALSLIWWLFDPGSFTVARWILLLLAGALVLTALALRAGRPRHAELLIDAAALAILVIALQGVVRIVIGTLSPFGGGVPANGTLSGFWEFVVLAAGCGLIAYGAVDRAPGPAWLGVVNLVAFIALVGPGEKTLEWWPLILLVLGAATIGAGLRPRQALPPEPPAYRAGEAPLATRTADDDVVLRVRDDGPASD